MTNNENELVGGYVEVHKKDLIEAQIDYLILDMFRDIRTNLYGVDVIDKLKAIEENWNNICNKNKYRLFDKSIYGRLTELGCKHGVLSIVSNIDKRNVYMQGPKTKYMSLLNEKAMFVLEGLGVSISKSIIKLENDENKILTNEQLEKLTKKHRYLLIKDVEETDLWKEYLKTCTI